MGLTVWMIGLAGVASGVKIMPKVLHDPISEAMEKKFPLKLRCAKCKRTLEFSVEELEVKFGSFNGSGKGGKLATCKCVWFLNRN